MKSALPLVDAEKSSLNLSDLSVALDRSDELKNLPAGGDDPNRFDWQEVWYPIAYLQDLDKDKLSTFTLLERDLVIWWDQNVGTWRVFDDQCPHRLARLSEGRIDENGWLECPYHGWAFSGSGDCERIPQQVQGRSAETSPRACVESLPISIQQGLLFVYPGQAERAALTPVPIVDPIEESPDDWIILDGFRDLPYDVLTLLENVLDPSHLPYTHHRSVGNRDNAGPVELDVQQSGKQGFEGIWEEGPRQGKLGRQTTTFVAPGLMWHDLTSSQYGRTLTVVYATPIRKGECRIFARFPFQFASKFPAWMISHTPRWLSHLGQNAILEDDQIFLHFQERYLERTREDKSIAQAFYLPTRADRFVLALHQWQEQFHANPFPGQSLPPAQSRDQLLDRYHSHTVNCSSCSQALKNVKRLRTLMVALTLVAWTVTPLLAFGFGFFSIKLSVAATLLIFTAAVTWLSLGQLEKRFLKGRSVPPRNRPDKKGDKR
ncbi:Rieske 2Fe-2S domain-containing protein [Acaryochloris sp. IP29b_bin.137]|uniref:aromatic ring-hydroxylating dioxygenase subunit alpha n=1 Tax=Acaryochloris sp. IP29b_bin.137 TaxID=2969217 RepID=UPI002638BA25|nr:Rieske 2Fe-2S domain-containing protein [Acaryochloris sp. IP29b_bin.137]